MEVSMNRLVQMAIGSVFCGVFLGAVYDIIRFVRVLFSVDVSNPFLKRKKTAILRYLFVAVGDILFFAVASVLMCVFFFLFGDGRMRWFALAGAYGGFYLYYQTVGRLFIGVSSYLVGICKRVIKFAFCLVAKPFVLLFEFLRKKILLFWKLPIVRVLISRYNIFVAKRKRTRAAKEKKRRMKKREYCKN